MIFICGYGWDETLLAQHLYKEPRMEGEFVLNACVFVSHEFDVLRILLDQLMIQKN